MSLGLSVSWELFSIEKFFFASFLQFCGLVDVDAR